MKTRLVVFALAVMAFTGLALAEKPKVKPYAAGAPYGGIPLWHPGDKFIGVSGGACAGTCPVYELYLFDDGRVVFNGRKDTSKVGVRNKQVRPEVYTELLTMFVKTKVLDFSIRRRTCLRGRSMLIVMRSASDAGDVRTVSLNSGCEGHADLVKEIEGRFIDSTGVATWLVPPR
ncbi:MAG TPA: DUF6438 domain-containing protein [Steroidobacteraceae bacterium]|jgi:hypothetical protein|nr:DUF6438 domain-containing protein [Steroidobacteraceae bacterium]